MDNANDDAFMFLACLGLVSKRIRIFSRQDQHQSECTTEPMNE